MTDTPNDDPLVAFLGQQVILDTQGPLIYIGTLESVGATFLALRDADVHDIHDSPASKELYLVETYELGIRVNRTRVLVTRRDIASVSLLRDVRS